MVSPHDLSAVHDKHATRGRRRQATTGEVIDDRGGRRVGSAILIVDVMLTVPEDRHGKAVADGRLEREDASMPFVAGDQLVISIKDFT